jgi:hypothetical protein
MSDLLNHAFTSRRAMPLGPMPALRLDRAPLQAPEYRGQTPRACLHRLRQRQAALLAHVEAQALRPVRVVLDATQEREPRQYGALASVLLIVMLVVLAALPSLVRSLP